MAINVEKLEKILRLEAADNYKDQKVYRGLAAFINNWTREAIEAELSSEETRLIEQVSERLADYKAKTILERAKALQAVLDLTAYFTHGTVVPVLPRFTKTAPPTVPPLPPEPSISVKPAKPKKPIEPIDLHSPITVVKGVGEIYAKLLSFVNLKTVHDALYYFPFRHEDFSNFKKINELMFGQLESVVAQVTDTTSVRMSGGKEIIQVTVADATGQLNCIFFNRRMTYALKPGVQIVLSGKVDQWNNHLCFKSPSYEPADKELLSTGRLVPVYSVSGPLKLGTLRKLIKTCVDSYAQFLPEHLPAKILTQHDLPILSQAVQNYHFPPDNLQKRIARRRLAFDEFFMIQLGVLLKRHEWQEEQPGQPIETNQALLEAWYGSLNFKVSRVNPETSELETELRPLQFTGAQQQAIADILQDIAKPKPMNRLLQGDVGSGKTVVGATALLMAVASGFQGALMAPTQILAEQHYQGLRRLFEQLEASEVGQKLGIKVRLELLTGSIKKKDVLYRRIQSGEVDIIIGTSAVIQETVNFHRLGLVIIDEQHRFGVVQRKTLRGKGAASAANPDGTNPHLLVMTATPIPRTLSLTVYGDLDLSLMSEMPPGRQPIKTKWVMPNERKAAYNFIRKQVAQGRQAFVICPLVEESDKIEAKAAIEEHALLQEAVFPDLRVDLLHGRMKPSEKDAIMRRFQEREYDILVATSVIEVGIDIPNATVIMIEGADRFGLSQLHQFRGRVGRGQHQSYCLLLASEELSQDGRERLRAIETTTDGFVLAEIDLKMRGPGEFFGTRQSGVPNLRVAEADDIDLLEIARAEATNLFETDPGLQDPDHSLLFKKVEQLWSFEGDLS